MAENNKQDSPTREKRIDKPVVQGASFRKKTILSRFYDDFINVDFKHLKKKVHDSAVSFIKQGVSEIFKNSIDMILYGDNVPPTYDDRTPISSRVNFINYGAYSNKKSLPVRDFNNEVYSFGEVIVGTEKEAQKVISSIDELIASQYGQASVADLYDAAGLVGNSTDWKWGWTNFSDAHAERLPDGRYVIKTPRVELLKTN